MKHYKTAYAVGDRVSLKTRLVRGLFKDNGIFESGTELTVTEKHWMGFDAKTDSGEIISGLKDYHVNFISNAKTETT